MDKNNVYIDIHVLQTLPPSCVNRDDTGSPKTAFYGGVNRARVSSQAWKHAMREMFREQFEEEQVGSRTKKLVEMVAEEINNLTSEGDADKKAVTALTNAGIKLKDDKAAALFFISRAQARAIAKLSVEGCADKKAYQAAMKENPAIDMILFGRMAASDPSLNYDAAAQVAHSISTHAVHNEYDYFTAVDDFGDEDNAGAGHLGTVEFNSSTLYRYATVNVKEVHNALKEKTAEAIAGFISAFVRSMPTGKQNSFANRTLPDMVYVTIRRDQPINLAGAFEKPVVSDSGYAEKSERRLLDYARRIYDDYVGEPEKAFGLGSAILEISEKSTMPELIEKVKGWIDTEM